MILFPKNRDSQKTERETSDKTNVSN